MSEKCVLITGGSRGIGRACVEKFAAKGYDIAFCYHKNHDDAGAVQKAVEDKGSQCLVFCGDVGNSDFVSHMVEETIKTFGKIDVFVGNAGIAAYQLFTDISNNDWQTMVNTNLSGIFYCCRSVLPDMIRRHSGAIVLISSVWGQVGSSCEASYSAAKAGVIGLAKALAKEEGPSNIRVNAVAPGVIDTDMCKDIAPEVLREIYEDTPLGRLGKSKEVAEGVYFLASEAASFITGQVLTIDGGFAL